ncbi:hypothetical protein V0R52_08810 [Pseudomonas asiatica]|uniref:hypothetical protein n=1 Tax=Pseudomonas asiatica TaxID=2219225 RepID=UPI002E7BCCEC|nr:hypothetical protein [Pseudomonas asiatica]MEE1916491.1 hypothetical protein [Pseudomonas asiatica]
MFDSPKMIMANSPDLLEYVAREVTSRGVLGFSQLRSLISSPRLADYWIQDLNLDGLVEVGDSFLTKYSMLGDWDYKTYGIELSAWERIKGESVMLERGDLKAADARRSCVTRLQIWPFDPSTLGTEAMKLAIAVSYAPLELIYESRIVGAINEMLEAYGIDSDPGT